MREAVVVAWSGGKDSALALARLRDDPGIEVVGLITTVSREFDRISIHGVRRVLLHRQAAALGLPVVEAELSPRATNADYEAAFAGAVAAWRARVPSLRRIAFGDLYLSDIRAYREAQLARLGLEAVFPLWGAATDRLARAMLGEGYRPVVVCVDTNRLPARLVGADFDLEFLDALPATVDPCGENGEFHTFVAQGPIFRTPVYIRRGAVVERDGFAYADLLPAEPEPIP